VTTPTPYTGTFDEVKGHNALLIRKMLEMAIFIGPYDDVPPLDTILDVASNGLSLPGGYFRVGMTSKEAGADWTPNIDMSETPAYGYGQPVRRDMNSRAETLGFTMLESQRIAFEVYHGLDLSTVTATPEPVAPATGPNEIKWDHPDTPDTRYWRVFALGRDGQGAASIYHCEHLLRVTLTDVDPISWSDTDPLTYAVTLGAESDPVEGTAHRTFWGGPGFTTQLITDMGFARAA
jgi:hypothetical protein